MESRTTFSDVVVDTDAALRSTTLDTRTLPNDDTPQGGSEIAYAPPIAGTPPREVNLWGIELLVTPAIDDITATLTHEISRTLDPQTSRFRTNESIQVSNLTIERSLGDANPLDTTLVGSRIGTRVLPGEYPEGQAFDIRHILTGSESSFEVNGATIRGDVSLNIDAAGNANNLVGVSLLNTNVEGDFNFNFTGRPTSESTIVINQAGATYGENANFNANIQTEGGDTVFFQANSNVNGPNGFTVNSNIVAEGGSTRVSSSADNDLTLNEQVASIVTLIPDPNDIQRVIQTKNLIPSSANSTGEPPISGFEARRQLNLNGSGDVTVVAVDHTAAGTRVWANNVPGNLLVVREGNVEVDIPALAGTGISPDGPLSLCAVINTNDSGPGSLREAIECANVAPGTPWQLSCSQFRRAIRTS